MRGRGPSFSGRRLACASLSCVGLCTHDFIGEVSVRLCPLMDGRVHAYELLLTDPEGMCMADGGVTGSLRFELHYES